MTYRQMQRLSQLLGGLPAREKRVIWSTLERLSKAHAPIYDETDLAELLMAAITGHDQARRKKESDARTDRARRALIGARVPAEMAQAIREDAESKGLSVYRWILRAYTAELKFQPKPLVRWCEELQADCRHQDTKCEECPDV